MSNEQHTINIIGDPDGLELGELESAPAPVSELVCLACCEVFSSTRGEQLCAGCGGEKTDPGSVWFP